MTDSLDRVTHRIRRDLDPLDQGSRSAPPISGIDPRPTRPAPSIHRTYKERLHSLSQRMVAAQKPILILDAIRWTDDIVEFLRRTSYRELPPVDADYYRALPLRFDPADKAEEFAVLEVDIRKTLGESDPLGAILIRNCGQYRQVVQMLQARGTPDFHRHARDLYGSPRDVFLDGRTTILDLGLQIYDVLAGLHEDSLGGRPPRDLSAEQAVEILNRGFESYFDDQAICARLDDGILSDAAAGADYVKVKRDAVFSLRDVEILEVHEGWVHVGTTQNGLAQPVATWLAKGPPCTTATQEGLAVLTEVLSFVSVPSRAHRINNRILAIDKAEQGADLLDVIEFYRTEGLDESDCLANAQRVFRGGVVGGGAPFTKDICYCKGLVQNYNFLQACVRFGRPELIPFLFVGKVALEDVAVLHDAWRERVIEVPRYVPRPFRDLNGLSIWLAYSNFLSKIDQVEVQRVLRPIIRPSESSWRPT